MRTMLRALPVLMAAVLAGAPGLAAQETPEQVVSRYFDTFRAGDYAGNVALTHPEALEAMRETMAGLVALSGTENPQFREMFGVSGMEEFNRLTSAQLFERLLRWQLEKPEMREVLSGTRTTVLGHVMEGDSTAHVVYRMRMSIREMDVDQVQVASVKRAANGQWRVLLTGNFAGMMNAAPRAERGPE
jgi:hypothetical protein